MKRIKLINVGSLIDDHVVIKDDGYRLYVQSVQTNSPPYTSRGAMIIFEYKYCEDTILAQKVIDYIMNRL
jgi:hypothetical protein